MKHLLLKIAGAHTAPLDIIIHEGVTVGDVFAATDLNGCALHLVGSPSKFLTAKEALYGEVTEGSTLYVVPRISAETPEQHERR